MVFEFMALGFKPQSRLKQMVDVGRHPFAQCFAQIDVEFRPKAHIDFAIGGKADAIAMVAEILAHWRDKAEAQTFAKWLLGNSAQTYFVEKTAEYSLTGLPAQGDLPPLDEIPAAKIDLGALAPLAQTLELMRSAGLTD